MLLVVLNFRWVALWQFRWERVRWSAFFFYCFFVFCKSAHLCFTFECRIYRIPRFGIDDAVLSHACVLLYE